ncbi:MAG: hypothetical protein M3Q48_05555, partial [Actinomycetota bacterium]|nr:hypothetical protein [Actinomycetota bacterium]
PASASPRPTPAAERRATPRGPVVAVLVAVAILLVAVVAALSRPGDDDPRPAAAPPAPTTTTPSTTTAPRSRRTTAPAAPRQQGVPADWTTYTDPKTGYVIGRPPGWEVRPLDGTRTDIVDPSTGSYLRVDWTDTPGDSPVAAWEAQSRSFGSRHDEYVEIRIEPTTFKGFDAAIWEYAYSSRGARLHGIDLGMVTGRYGFALNFQTPEGLWEASQPTFEAFKASFVAPR